MILLFFDPDKPGTTGETLNILTSSLVGLDHKLHIILNKVLAVYIACMYVFEYAKLSLLLLGGPVRQDPRLRSGVRIALLESQQG